MAVMENGRVEAAKRAGRVLIALIADRATVGLNMVEIASELELELEIREE